MEIIVMVIVGFIVGLVARFVMPGNDSAGIIVTSLIGIVGAVVGGYIGQATGLYLPGEPAGFLMSVVGAMVVLLVFRVIRGRL